MKGLDTPLLLAILRGRNPVLPLLNELKAEELATTEWNMLELEQLARADPTPGRERRLVGLERLRRTVTVLPIDDRAIHRSLHRLGKQPGPAALARAAMLGAAEAAGADEWFTLDHVPKVDAKRLKLRRVRLSLSK